MSDPALPAELGYPSLCGGGPAPGSLPHTSPAGQGRGGDACGQTTTPSSGTTFPSGSSGGRTCSVRLPATPGSSRRGARCGAGELSCGSRRSSRRSSRRFPVRLPAELPAAPSAAPGAAWLPVRPPVRLLAAPGAAPGAMPRGRAWTQAEVSSLLALVEGSGEAALLMASTSRPNEALWREISQGLAAAGYGRSVAQCRSKWKALKQAFHSERETRRRAGCHSPRLPPHYRAMKSIWKAAGRPVFGERRMPDLVRQRPRKRRSALAARSPSSPKLPERDAGKDAPGMLLSPLLQCAKDEPDSPARGGDHIAGVLPTPPAVPHAGGCFPSLPHLGCNAALKQEKAEQKAAGFPGETSPGMGRRNRVLPMATAALGSPGMAAMSEQPATSEEASDASLHGSGVAGLLQNVQQLLVQILQTSRQQQALLESLASDTVSHLHLLSHSLVQVGETLHQLLLRPQTHLGPLSHYSPHVPLFEGGPGVPCSPGSPHTSPDHKEEPQVSPASGCIPP
ncbi:uncharacterized protein [Numenius arquata]|uniref:uncharacterized protein n=1 Tax=Numenius arquata TaxID=31919 RepID=UPI003D30B25D